jgi:hypothetical protein
MTTIAMATLTQVGATLLAITIAAILAPTASVAATPPDSTHGRRCFRATTAAGAGEAIFAAVDSILEYAGARSYVQCASSAVAQPENADRGRALLP